MNLIDYKIRHKYPHMRTNETRIWTRFIEAHPDFFTTVAYDVPVGKGHPEIPDLPDYLKDMAKLLSQKRIDVVGFKSTAIWLIEVKVIVDISAPGQVIAYKHLFQKQFPAKLPIVPALVYERCQPDMLSVAVELGVLTFCLAE